MSKKRRYRSISVEGLRPEVVLAKLGPEPECTVSVDVAKERYVVGLGAGGVVALVLHFIVSQQAVLFLELLSALTAAGKRLAVVLESTGTYGDWLRGQAEARGWPILRVQSKHTHDFAELQDGLPGKHDAKDVHILAQLHALGRSAPWPLAASASRDLRVLVDEAAVQKARLEEDYNRMEAWLARHWPELACWVDLRTASTLGLLAACPGPAAVRAMPEVALHELARASRGQLSETRRQGVVTSAQQTVGLPVTSGEAEGLRRMSERLREGEANVARLELQLRAAAHEDPEVERLSAVVGVLAAASIQATVGAPSRYGSAQAFLKSLGLMLYERSSGVQQGARHLSKRGPDRVRQLLFMATLRMLHPEHGDPVARAWYVRRHAYQCGHRTAAVVAVMRKLATALWHVARGSAFDASKLFDTRRLTPTDIPTSDARVDAPRAARFTRETPRTTTVRRVTRSRVTSPTTEVRP